MLEQGNCYLSKSCNMGMVTLSQNVSLRLESVNSPIRSRAIIISSESTHLKKTWDLFIWCCLSPFWSFSSIRFDCNDMTTHSALRLLIFQWKENLRFCSFVKSRADGKSGLAWNWQVAPGVWYVTSEIDRSWSLICHMATTQIRSPSMSWIPNLKYTWV